jgi:hypothetical protein
LAHRDLVLNVELGDDIAMTLGFFAKASATTLLLFAFAQQAHAQGSMGGSIGVQEKSVSGDREPSRAAPPPPPARQRSAPEPKRAAPKPAGRPVSYDGAWLVNNIGCGGAAGRVSVSGGRISGDGGVTGSVSANGTVSTRTSVSVGWGRVSGNRGSGGFRTNDGCTGRWTSVRQ